MLVQDEEIAFTIKRGVKEEKKSERRIEYVRDIQRDRSRGKEDKKE